jgi:hypothetical protein
MEGPGVTTLNFSITSRTESESPNFRADGHIHFRKGMQKFDKHNLPIK